MKFRNFRTHNSWIKLHTKFHYFKGCLKFCVIYVMLISIRPEKGANKFLSFQTLSKILKNVHRIGWKKEQNYSTCYFADIPLLCMQTKWFVLRHVIYVFSFYTPVFRRDVLWYGDVRPSVRPGLRPPVRPSVTVFRTFLVHALTYWSEILCITLFLCT